MGSNPTATARSSVSTGPFRERMAPDVSHTLREVRLVARGEGLLTSGRQLNRWLAVAARHIGSVGEPQFGAPRWHLSGDLNAHRSTSGAAVRANGRIRGFPNDELCGQPEVSR